MENVKIKEKAIYSGLKELIINILAHFLLFKMAITCSQVFWISQLRIKNMDVDFERENVCD